MTERQLHCANRSLYLAASLMLLGCCAYSIFCKDELWQQIIAAVAAVCTLLWGGYYVSLSYRLNTEGICRRSLFGCCRLRWDTLDTLDIQERNSQETKSLSILLRSGEKQLRLSSDLLSLEDMEELLRELQEQDFYRKLRQI